MASQHYKINSQKAFEENISKKAFKEKTHEFFRTKQGEELRYDEVRDFIIEQAKETGVSDKMLMQRLKKKLDLQHADAQKINNFLKQKFLDDSEQGEIEKANQAEMERRRMIVQMIMNMNQEDDKNQELN